MFLFTSLFFSIIGIEAIKSNTCYLNIPIVIGYDFQDFTCCFDTAVYISGQTVTQHLIAKFTLCYCCEII